MQSLSKENSTHRPLLAFFLFFLFFFLVGLDLNPGPRPYFVLIFQNGFAKQEKASRLFTGSGYPLLRVGLRNE
jgi:hypothetical protein